MKRMEKERKEPLVKKILMEFFSDVGELTNKRSFSVWGQGFGKKETESFICEAQKEKLRTPIPCSNWKGSYRSTV